MLVTFVIDHQVAKGRSPKRSRIVAIACLIVLAEAVLVAADGLGSNGLWIPFQDTGMTLGGTWLDFMDFISEGVAMPLGALVMSILVGWVIGPKVIRSEVSLEGNTMKDGLYSFFSICIRFVAPVAMAFILYGQVTTFISPA